MLFLLAAAAASFSALAADRLQFSAPRREGGIKVDGRLDDWDKSFVIDGICDLVGMLYPRRCSWLVCWDEENLYLASKSQLRENERLVRGQRDPQVPDSVVFDDSVEFVLNPMGRDDRKSRYQLLVNTMGVAAGIRQQTVAPAGEKNPESSWQCQKLFNDWKPEVETAFSFSPDRKWLLCEMKVPVKNLGVKANSAGDVWGCVLARNYKNPWQQTSIGGLGGWPLPANNALLALTDKGLCCSLDDLNIGADAELFVETSMVNQSDQEQEFIVEIKVAQGKDEIFSVRENVRVGAGKTEKYGLRRKLGGNPRQNYSLRIKACRGEETLMDYSAQMRPGFAEDIMKPFPAGMPYPVEIRPNPFRGECFLKADLIDIPDNAKITGVRWSVCDGSGRIHSKGMLADKVRDFIEGTVQFSGLPPGIYYVETAIMEGDHEIQKDSCEFTKGSIEKLACDARIGDDERIVFLGDSITEADHYPAFIEYMLRTRHPGKKLWFSDAGIGGDTSDFRMRGGWKKGLSEIIAMNPTLVTVMFGMNQRGSFGGVDRRILQAFMDTTAFNVETLRNSGARVMLMSSSPVNRSLDPSWTPEEDNAMLAAQNMKLAEYCAGSGIPFLDILTPALAEFRKLPKLSNGDPIHPSPQGNLVMASVIAAKLDINPVVAEAAVDADSAKVARQFQCKVSDLKPVEGGIAFTKHDDFLGLPADEPLRCAVESVPLVQARSRHVLAVSGLPEGTYKITIDGQDAGEFTAKQLADGICESLLKGPSSAQAQKAFDLVYQKCELVRYHWRKYLCGAESPKPPSIKDWKDGGRDAVENEIARKEGMIPEALRTVPHRWEVVRK